MANNAYKVAMLNPEGVVRLIHGLAFIKTLATKSKVSVEGYSLAGQVTHASIGENFDHLTFKRWVREEEASLMKQFQDACLKGPQQAWSWLDNANKARGKYFRNYQQTIEELNKINAQLADAYKMSTRIAASVQLAAETALVVYGLVGGAASMTVNLAIKKFVVGVGSGVAISMAEDWSSAKNADLIVAPATTFTSNIPGTIDDTFRNLCALLNNWHIGKLNKELTALKATIAAKVAEKNLLPKGGRAEIQAFLKSCYEQEKQLVKQVKNPSTGGFSKIGRGFAILNWGLAIKSEVDSVNKFVKHWNGDL